MVIPKSMILAMTATLGLSAFAKDKYETPERVPGEMIVKLSSDKADLGFLKSLGVMSVEPIEVSFGNFQLIQLSDDKSFDSTLEMLNNHPDVEYAEPNFIYRLIEPIVEDAGRQFVDKIVGDFPYSDYIPNVPRFDELWGLHNYGQGTPSNGASTRGADIDALRAWAIEKGSHSVKIAVIDTGIDYTHPDLADNMWTDEDGNFGYNFVNNTPNPMDGNGHGTHCAGTIGALHNNQLGVAGVMADVKMVGVKFLSDSGSGTTADAIRSVDYATNIGVDIMSNSWGGGGRSQALKEAIIRANDEGILFVAAAGNSSANNDLRDSFPANYDVDNVISVAATTGTDTLASFSSYGRTKVHIAAPGHQILSTVQNDNYRVLSGTSMATPHVSGALGLLLAQEGRLPVAEVRERLVATSDPLSSLRGRVMNNGRLNAYNLLTDTRPDRNEPNPDKWEVHVLETPWESEHPYNNNEYEERVFHVEGAKFMRLRVTKFDLEFRFDYLSVLDSSGDEVDRITGQGEDYASDYVEGDTMTVIFRTDHSVTGWGFLIEEIEAQFE